MNKWTYKVTSVSWEVFGLFPFIRVVGTHLSSCGRSCYFHDFITHETPIKLYSKSHFHRHGTSWAEPEVKVTSRGYCSTSLFCLRCCFVFITLWLSGFSLNLLRLTELLERHKAELGASSHPPAGVVYSQLFVGSTIHFPISPPSPNTLSVSWSLGPRKAWCFLYRVASCMMNTMGVCTAGIPAHPLLSKDPLLSAPPLCCETSNEPFPFCVSINFAFNTSDFDCRVAG